MFLTSIAHAELDTFTYVSHDGIGTGDFEGDISGQGLLTLLDSDGGDMWNDGDNFAYVHEGQARPGSFRATVRVVSQTEAIDGRWGKGGIRASANLGGTSAFAMSQVAAGNGSQIAPPAVGDHSPVPVRLAGRTVNQIPNGFEDPILAAPGTDAPLAGANVANNVFPATGQTNVSWLRLDYNALSDEFVAGYAIDTNGTPGVWNSSAPRSNIEHGTDGGWYVGLAYSAHSDLDFTQVTRPDNFHGITFDSFSVIDLPAFVGGEGTIDVNNTFRLEATAENVVTGPLSNPAGVVSFQVFDVANPGNYQAVLDITLNEIPSAEGLMPAPIFWPGSNGGVYPEEFGFEPGVNREGYTVNMTGEMFIEQNGEIIFKDGVDDFASLHIDTDGDGTLDEVINDGSWTNEFGVNNGGSPLSPAIFSNVAAEGEWRPFQFLTSEGGGGDSGALAWNAGAQGAGFPASQGQAFSMSNLVPASHLRAEGEVDDATVSFDAVLRLADVAETFEFDVNVEQLKWDKIGMSIPAQIGNNTPDSATLDLDGVTINVSLSEDPTAGLTVDLIDNTGITNITGTPTFSFSHGDAADWDTSSFTVNGQLSFSGGVMLQAGDYDGDGFVGQGDIDLVLLNWGNDVTGGPPNGWVTNLPGGNVDQDELDAVLLNWGEGSQGVGPAGVPEPSTIALLLLAAAVTLCRGRIGKKLLASTALVACLLGFSVQSSLAQIDIGGDGVIHEVFVTGELQNIVETAAPDNGLGLLYAERYSPRPTFDNWVNVQDYVANNTPTAEGILDAPPIWDNGNLGTYPYPPALGFPQSNQDQYGVRITGEILIPANGGIDFRDGADDQTVFIIDEAGDGSLDNDLPIIEDTAWTSLDGTGNNGGIGPGTFGLGSFSNVEPGGSWRMFELTMSEGGGGDRLSLAWSVDDDNNSFNPAIEGIAQLGFSLNEGDDLIPRENYRLPGAMILESFDSVLNYNSGANFEVNVEELAWDRVASNAHVTTADVNYVVDFSGGVLTLDLSSDPVPGLTVDLVDDSANVDEIRPPASFAFSHGDPAMWDTSNFTTNGQITFGSGAISQPGDYDGDGLVGQGDMDLVLLNWGLSGNDLPDGWVISAPNSNIDQDELDAVLLNWGEGSQLGQGGVPEPSTIVMLLIAVLVVTGFSRARR